MFERFRMIFMRSWCIIWNDQDYGCRVQGVIRGKIEKHGSDEAHGAGIKHGRTQEIHCKIMNRCKDKHGNLSILPENKIFNKELCPYASLTLQI